MEPPLGSRKQTPGYGMESSNIALQKKSHCHVDEIWTHHHVPESKPQNTEWKHPTSPVKKKFRTQPWVGKVMHRGKYGTLQREGKQ
jgi:hypothetical protein